MSTRTPYNFEALATHETQREYERGLHDGAAWAAEDRASSTPTGETLVMLREESRTDQRWARAFYLGALRGYRETVRTLRDGRWGT